MRGVIAEHLHNLDRNDPIRLKIRLECDPEVRRTVGRAGCKAMVILSNE
jgi:hypothetical protein